MMAYLLLLFLIILTIILYKKNTCSNKCLKCGLCKGEEK